MAYVVVIELDNEQKDYKVFTNSADAVARFENAKSGKWSGRIQKTRKGEEVTIVDCQMFKVTTANAREAVQLVKAGMAEPFKIPISDRSSKLIDELLAGLDKPKKLDDKKPHRRISRGIVAPVGSPMQPPMGR